MGLLWPKCRTRHLALLNLIQLALAHQSSLSRSLYRAFLPSSRSTLLPNFGVICRLPEGALNPLIQIIDKDIKQDWPQNWALENMTHDRLPADFIPIHHHSLGPDIQMVFNPLKCNGKFGFMTWVTVWAERSEVGKTSVDLKWSGKKRRG